MSGHTKSPSDLDLMLYRDGELSEADAKAVAEAIAGDSSARTKVEALDQIEETVRTSLELESDAADVALAGLWERVQQRIETNGQSAPAQAVRTDKGPSLMQRLVAWFEDYRAHVVPGAVTAAAVAVAMLLTRPDPQIKVVKVPVEPVKAHEPTMVLQPQPPEVESLEVYDGSGTILTLPGEDGEGATSVIWLAPEETEPTEGPL
jgi:hypothetical protein